MICNKSSNSNANKMILAKLSVTIKRTECLSIHVNLYKNLSDASLSNLSCLTFMPHRTLNYRFVTSDYLSF